MGWGDVFAGFWGWGNLMNRPHGVIGDPYFWDKPIGIVMIDWADVNAHGSWDPEGRWHWAVPYFHLALEGWPQEPVSQIIKDIKKQDARMKQARDEFEDCVKSNPKVAEYQKRYAEAKPDYSYVYGRVGSQAVKAGMAGTTVVLATKLNIFTNILYLIVLPDLIYADQNKAYTELRNVSRPIEKECAKLVNQKYGLTVSLKR